MSIIVTKSISWVIESNAFLKSTKVEVRQPEVLEILFDSYSSGNIYSSVGSFLVH